MKNDLTGKVIGAAIEVHKELGPGLLESIYRQCLVKELRALGLLVSEELALPVIYKGERLDSSFRVDVLVENHLVIELKAIEHILPVHTAQIISYLKMCNKPLGLLINFNVPVLKQGIKRFAN